MDKNLPRMIQLRHWLNNGRPELLAILAAVYQTLLTDAAIVTV